MTWAEEFEARWSAAYEEAISSLLIAKVRRNAPAAADARGRLQRLVATTMGLGEVYGAGMMLRRAAVLVRENFRESGVPAVELTDALDDMITRTPVTLRDAAERTAQRIARLYGEDRVVAFARAAEDTVTRQAQEVLARVFREGLTEEESIRELRTAVDRVRTETEPWTSAYARVAIRTNITSAVTAGRFRQARDPDIAAVMPAFRFDSIGDADTRSNHGAADGLVFSVANPVWNRIAPPLGYNCRCQVVAVSVPELRRMGRLRDGTLVEDQLPAGAFPDPGFRHGGRPDLAP